MSLALLLAAAGAAATPSPLAVTSRLVVERAVTAADGTVRTEPVASGRAVPGDRVTVVVDYRNTGAAPLANLVIANPLPAGLRFRQGVSPRLEVSVDGSRYAPLAALVVPLPGGGTRPAQPDDIRAVRWRIPAPLPAGASGQFTFAAAIQ